jgi:crooked neck
MTEIEMKPPPVRNLGASSIQLTADQILKDAEIHRQITIKPPLQTIMDEKELMVYTQEKRRFFEDKLRRQRYNLSVWVRYAQWE